MIRMDDVAARRDVMERIDALDRGLVGMTPREQMHRLLAIKGVAQAGRLRAVASLAAALESDLLAHGAEAPVHAYLERMADAVDLAAEDERRFVDLALASVGAGLAFA